MWVLVGEESCQEIGKKWLRPGKIYTLGRKVDSDIVIRGEKSVTRSHCTITVGDGNAENVVVLCDLKSTFGVYINNARVCERQTVNEGDIVKLGVGKSVFRLTWHPIVICCSGMRAQQKNELVECVKDLDFKVVSKDWLPSVATHLLMAKIKITQKLIIALAEGRPIIDDTWIKQVKGAAEVLEKSFELPDERNHLPPLAFMDGVEVSQVNFGFVPARQSLLLGRTFVCFQPNQLARILGVVKGCGGKAVEVILGEDVENTAEAIVALANKYSNLTLMDPLSAGNSHESGAENEWAAVEEAARAYDFGCFIFGVASQKIRFDKSFNDLVKSAASKCA